MKPVLREGKLSVELHKPDIAVLEKALDIGHMLESLHRKNGTQLIAAIDAVLGKGEETES